MLPNPGLLTALRAHAPGPSPLVPLPAPNPLAGILTNPGVVQADLARQQQIQQANAALRQQRSQALIGFGSPQLAGTYGDAVDPNTAAAAAANPYSVLAGLGRRNTDAHRALLNSLAGHGLLHSGDLGHREGQQAHAFGQASYDATQSLLAHLNGYLNNYLDQNQSANDAYTNALLQSFSAYGQNPLGLLG